MPLNDLQFSPDNAMESVHDSTGWPGRSHTGGDRQILRLGAAETARSLSMSGRDEDGASVGSFYLGDLSG